MLRRPLNALLLVLGLLAPAVPAAAVADHSGGYVVKASTSRSAGSIGSAATRVTDPRCPDPTVCSRAIDLPFPVTVYGQTASRVWAQKEGTLLLRVAEPFTGQTGVPDATYGAELAPYLAHLEYAGSGDGVFTETTGTAPHRHTVIEWRSHQSASAAPVVFQTVLSEDTAAVTYRYLHVEATPRPVVGAQNDDASRYVTYAGRLHDRLAVTLSTPDRRVSQVRLTLPSGTVTYGQDATVRADVVRLGRGQVPTGQVAFLSDGVEIGRGRLDAWGRATFSGNTRYLPGDGPTYDLTARYLGDRLTSPGNSQSGRLTLAPATTSATFVSPAAPGTVTYGTPYAIRVTTDPTGAGDPDGAVQWYDNDTGYVGSSSVVDGTATLPGDALPRGRHTLVANYLPRDHFTGFNIKIDVDVQ